MALLLETNLGGDLVIDLDLEGSPKLCFNVLKLAKIRYYTSTLLYNVHANRFVQGGDPRGNGKGGACIYGVLDDNTGNNDETLSKKRFLSSSLGRRLTPDECREPGRMVALELRNTKDTIGSQFLITLGQGRSGDALDGYMADEGSAPLSLGVVAEDDNNILKKISNSYCDPEGRPYADIRITRMIVLHDPFPDPPGLMDYLRDRVPGLIMDQESRSITASPDPVRPEQERVPERIPVNQLDDEEEETPEQARERQEREAKQQDHQRAVVLELLGDLPSADLKAPENVLFVCKLNPVTQDEDLELIFSRFDPNVKVEIIRDPETGSSLQYAFCEFSEKQQCVEAYFKMNNALVDDRRIKVDFSQSVAKLWNKHTLKLKMPKEPYAGGGHNRNGPPHQTIYPRNEARPGGRPMDNRPQDRNNNLGQRGRLGQNDRGRNDVDLRDSNQGGQRYDSRRHYEGDNRFNDNPRERHVRSRERDDHSRDNRSSRILSDSDRPRSKDQGTYSEYRGHGHHGEHRSHHHERDDDDRDERKRHKKESKYRDRERRRDEKRLKRKSRHRDDNSGSDDDREGLRKGRHESDEERSRRKHRKRHRERHDREKREHKHRRRDQDREKSHRDGDKNRSDDDKDEPGGGRMESRRDDYSDSGHSEDRSRGRVKHERREQDGRSESDEEERYRRRKHRRRDEPRGDEDRRRHSRKSHNTDR